MPKKTHYRLYMRVQKVELGGVTGFKDKKTTVYCAKKLDTLQNLFNECFDMAQRLMMKVGNEPNKTAG